MLCGCTSRQIALLRFFLHSKRRESTQNIDLTETVGIASRNMLSCLKYLQTFAQTQRQSLFFQGISKIADRRKTIIPETSAIITIKVAREVVEIMSGKIGRIQWGIIPTICIPTHSHRHPSGHRRNLGPNLINFLGSTDPLEPSLEIPSPLLPFFLETQFWLLVSPLQLSPHCHFLGYNLPWRFTLN